VTIVAAALALAIMLVGALYVGAYVILHWRKESVFLAFATWLHIQDLVRIVSRLPSQVYFVQTIFFGLLMAGAIRSRRILRDDTVLFFPAPLALLAFLVLAAAQSFNPYLEARAVPFVGLHAQFVWPLATVIAYNYFDTEEKLGRFMWLMVILTSIECLIAVAQVAFGPIWWYNLLGNPEMRLFVRRSGAVGGEDFLRTASWFVDAGRFGQYLAMAAPIVAAGTYFTARKRITAPGYVALAILSVGVFINGSRTTMILGLPSLLAIIIWGDLSLRRVIPIAVAVVGSIVGAVLIAQVVAGDVAPFITRVLLQPFTADAANPNSIVGRIALLSAPMERAVRESGFIGHGLGSNSLGLGFLRMETVGEEPGYAMLVWEYGILGPFFWLAVHLTILARTLFIYRHVHSVALKKFAAAAMIVEIYALIFQFIGYQIMQNYLVAAFFWLLVGAVFALPRIRERSPPSVPAATA
jgi:hypothetical protein